MRSLDPHVPYLRNACLKAATNLVHELVLRFPMVAFHQESQRLAVGDKKGPIYIYDLISATRWFTLEGHKTPLSALSFSGDGKVLASYSIPESRVALWKISSSFFGILGSNTSCYKTVPVSPTHRMYSINSLQLSLIHSRSGHLRTSFGGHENAMDRTERLPVDPNVGRRGGQNFDMIISDGRRLSLGTRKFMVGEIE